LRILRNSSVSARSASALLIALACAALLGLGAACSAGECESDADCGEGYRCSESGGALYGGNQCVAARGEHEETAVPDAGPDASANSSPDDCDDTSCSDAGRCFLNDRDQPYCECDDGYSADGLDCIANDPCAGVDCSGHGTCADEGEDLTCDCDPGYEADGLECRQIPEDCMTSSDVSCDGWVLRADEAAWEGFTVDLQSTAGVQAAASVDLDGNESGVIALGDQGAVLVRVDSWEFVEVVDHNVLSASDQAIAAYAKPLDDERTLVAVHGLNEIDGVNPEPVVSYSVYDAIDGLRVLTPDEESEIGATPELSASLSEAVLAAWFDPENFNGWVSEYGDEECTNDDDCEAGNSCMQRANGRDFCKADCSGQQGITAHVAYLTDQHLHAWGDQSCEQFLPASELSSLPLLSGQEAPPVDQVAAGFWRGGDLYLIRGQ
jgi:hypothetical protein